MGALASRLFGNWINSEPVEVLMLGLDAAGKTTLLYRVKLNETVASVSTTGFNKETVLSSKRQKLCICDVGGILKVRNLWYNFCTEASGLFWVVDSSDHERLLESKQALQSLLEDEALANNNIPVVVIANKQDLPNSMLPAEVLDGVHLGEAGMRKWLVQGTSATDGTGVIESMDAMIQMIKDSKKMSEKTKKSMRK